MKWTLHYHIFSIRKKIHNFKSVEVQNKIPKLNPKWLVKIYFAQKYLQLLNIIKYIKFGYKVHNPKWKIVNFLVVAGEIDEFADRKATYNMDDDDE